MLTVNTKLGTSKISGVGLFATEFIPKGTIIWKFDPFLDKRITNEEFDVQPLIVKKFLSTYCFAFNDALYLCVDNARFFNHSKTPNCFSDEMSETHLGYTKALRDIEVGEELTDDYAGFGITTDDREFNTML